MQVDRSAHPSELPRPGQLVGHGERVRRLTAAIEIEDGVVDKLVSRTIEVRRAQYFDDIGDRVLGQQHAAEHALLRGDVLRRRAIQPAGHDPGVVSECQGARPLPQVNRAGINRGELHEKVYRDPLTIFATVFRAADPWTP